MVYFLLAALHLQKSPAGSLLPQQSTSWIQPLSTQSQLCQQKIRLQSLQMERERLKLRQQEIMRQVIIQFIIIVTWLFNYVDQSSC
jgi:protein yorkie